MYKVFVNNSPIHLSTQAFISNEFTSIPIRKANFEEIIEQLQGGKVYNSEHKILFIKRNGYWDLPKGKTEKGESIEETSVREVEEETGVKLYPQEEENITKVKWKSTEKTIKALENTYGTISQLFSREYLVKKVSKKLMEA